MTELYRYGPIVFYTTPDEEDTGNYYWRGKSIIGYDDMGIPVDEFGDQCLDLECILHPHYKPKELVFNEFLNMKIPTVSSCKAWLDNALLDVSEGDVKKYILRFLFMQKEHGMYRKGRETTLGGNLYTMLSYKLMNDCQGNTQTLLKRIWPL